MNQTKKKRFSIICLIMVLLISVFPITAFAYTSKDVDEIIEQIGAIAQTDDDGNLDSDAMAVKDEIVEMLKDDSTWSTYHEKNEMYPQSWDDVQSRDDGYLLIQMAIYNTDADNNALTLWEENFDEEAKQLGIGQYSSAGTSSASALEATGKKINILTWNNEKDTNENEYADANKGKLEKVLTDMDNHLSSVFATLRAIAVALTIAFGLSKILGMSTERNVSGDAVTREFIKVIAGAWFIMNFKFFAMLLINLGSSLITLFLDNMAADDTANMQYAIFKSFLTTCSQGNIMTVGSQILKGFGNLIRSLGNSISNIGSSLLAFFGNEVIEIASSLAVYSVLLEMMIRYAFTPIAIADLYSERFRSSGWMWLKKLLACAMTGAVMYMMIWVCNLLTNNLSGSILSTVAINLTMISMLFRAHGIANEIVGAH